MNKIKFYKHFLVIEILSEWKHLQRGVHPPICKLTLL
jgi:hypothetical protein